MVWTNNKSTFCKPFFRLCGVFCSLCRSSLIVSFTPKYLNLVEKVLKSDLLPLIRHDMAMVMGGNYITHVSNKVMLATKQQHQQQRSRPFDPNAAGLPHKQEIYGYVNTPIHEHEWKKRMSTACSKSKASSMIYVQVSPCLRSRQRAKKTRDLAPLPIFHS